MAQKIKTIIIDDEKRSTEILNELIKKYCPEIDVVGIAHSAKVGKEIIRENNPDLVFLDIQMPFETGFDLLKNIGKIDFEVIFVTGFNQFAIQAIKFHALDYLLKPIDIEELELSVSKVSTRMKQKLDTERLEQLVESLMDTDNNNQHITIAGRNGKEILKLSQIIRCSADGACTWFYLSDGRKLMSSKNLGEYEKLFPQPDEKYTNRFIRVHYGDLVNLSFIKKYNSKDKSITMKDGNIVKIAQRRATAFMNILKDMNINS